MDNLGDIRLFVEAATVGGISAAGRRLGLSPAAASARLTKLESTLQTRLFERTTRQLRLTEEGRFFLTQCQQALQTLDDAQETLLAGKQVVRGKIKISATHDFGQYLLQPWLEAFTQRYPDVRISLHLSDALSDFVGDDVDLAIRFGVLPDSSLVARRLAPNHRVLCASPGYLAAHGTPAHPRDLADFECIVLTNAAGTGNDWQMSRGEENSHYSVPMDRAHETNNGTVARLWAVQGYGIALKSVWDIAEDVCAGRLSLVLPDWHSGQGAVHALYPSNHHLLPRVRALLDFLVEQFDTATDGLHRVPGLRLAS